MILTHTRPCLGLVRIHTYERTRCINIINMNHSCLELNNIHDRNGGRCLYETIMWVLIYWRL